MISLAQTTSTTVQRRITVAMATAANSSLAEKRDVGTDTSVPTSQGKSDLPLGLYWKD